MAMAGTLPTWQGWIVLLVYTVLVVYNAIRIDSNSHSVSDTLINFVPQTIGLTVLLVIVCYMTGEKAKWRWGNKDKK